MINSFHQQGGPVSNSLNRHQDLKAIASLQQFLQEFLLVADAQNGDPIHADRPTAGL